MSDDADGYSMTRWAFLVLPWLAGCGVSTLSEDEAQPTRNACSSDAECGSGTCQAGMCRAIEGTFSSVLFEVTPPASVAGIGSTQHLKRIDGLSLGGGPQDIALARPAHLVGVITPNWLDRELCALHKDNPSSTVRVILTPSDQLLGLAAQPYSVDATYVDGRFKFDLHVPAGDYDIYLEPKNQPAECPLAPQLYARNTVPEGTNKVDVPLNLPAPSKLDLRVMWPAGADPLDGWRVDMIDPETRLQLSNEVELTWETRTPDAYSATLFYSKVIPVRAEPGRELIRLRPQMGVAAPTILLQRSGVELQVPGKGEIDQLQTLPRTVECQGQVALAGAPIAVPRTSVTITATKLDQAAGLRSGSSTEYSVTVMADDKGSFSADLFPGTYKVVVVPPMGSGYATGIDDWVVSDNVDVQMGRTIEVKRLVTLTGSVITPAAAPVAGATVSAVASANLASDPLVASAVVVPRAGNTQVDANGAFQFGAEPGNYDLSVRPAPGTGFAWFVRPNVSVGQGEFIDLGELQLPLPVSYKGAVTAEVDGVRQAVPGALIRAYVYVTSERVYTFDTAKAASVLQIGEARASDSGRFELFVPAQFDRPAPAP